MLVTITQTWSYRAMSGVYNTHTHTDHNGLVTLLSSAQETRGEDI